MFILVQTIRIDAEILMLMLFDDIQTFLFFKNPRYLRDQLIQSYPLTWILGMPDIEYSAFTTIQVADATSNNGRVRKISYDENDQTDSSNLHLPHGTGDFWSWLRRSC